VVIRRGNATAVDGSTYSDNSASLAQPSRWKREEIQKIYDGPLMDLVFRAVCPPNS
jgi:hypothetical protein